MREKHQNLRKTPTEKAYYKWLEGFPCCLSGRTDGIQYAHTGGQAEGKGMGRKAHLSTVLPLHYSLHRAEEAGRDQFWETALGESPVPYAERLFDCFEKDDRDAAAVLLMDMHETAMGRCPAFLRSILVRAA